jgi:rubrerythrin
MILFPPFWRRHSDNADKNRKYIQTAREKLRTVKDKELLAQIVREAPLIEVKISAVTKIQDDKLLTEIAEETADIAMKLAAIENIQDKETALGIIDKITDENLLTEIFMKTHITDVARTAFAKIQKKEWALIKAIYAKDFTFRVEAIKQISDKPTLTRIAEGKKTPEAMAARARLYTLETKYRNSPDGILNTTKNSGNLWERLAAAKKLTDKDLQEQIYYEIATDGNPDHITHCDTAIEAANLIADKEIRQQAFFEIANRFNHFGKQTRKEISEQLTDRKFVTATLKNKKLESGLRVTLVVKNGFTFCEKCGGIKELTEHSCACPKCGEVHHLFTRRQADSIAFDECVVCGEKANIEFSNAKAGEPTKCPQCGMLSAFKNCRCEHCGVKGHILIPRSSEERGGGVTAHWDTWEQCVNCGFETEKIDNWRYTDGY